MQQAGVALHQPVGHLGLRRDHFDGCGLLARGPALAQGELGDVVLDLDLAGAAVVKLDGEAGVALHHGGHPAPARLRIPGGRLVCRHLCGPRRGDLLAGDLEVAGLPPERVALRLRGGPEGGRRPHEVSVPLSQLLGPLCGGTRAQARYVLTGAPSPHPPPRGPRAPCLPAHGPAEGTSRAGCPPGLTRVGLLLAPLLGQAATIVLTPPGGLPVQGCAVGRRLCRGRVGPWVPVAPTQTEAETRSWGRCWGLQGAPAPPPSSDLQLPRTLASHPEAHFCNPGG